MDTSPTYTKAELEKHYSLKYMEQRMGGLVDLTSMFKNDKDLKNPKKDQGAGS